ncbi:MAG: class I SAM-dependent methyltransferase [Marmoricola sp.]
MTGTNHGGSPSIAEPDYWWYRARSELLRVSLEEYVGQPSRTLDVGSADGPSVGWLTDVGKVSLDIDPRGLDSGGVCGSVLDLPFRDTTFDVVTAFDVIEHCAPEQRALAELRRVLVPGGRLLASVPAYQWAWTRHDVDNGHHRRYTRKRLVTALQSSGFAVERVTYAFSSVFPFFAAERLARRVLERAQKQPSDGPADVVGVPHVAPSVERLLMALTRFDERLLASRDLPFGSSVFVAATKLDSGQTG